MTLSTEIRLLAARFGFELVRKRRHAVWRHRTTGVLVITGATPSDHRALLNIEHRFRRAARQSTPDTSP